MNRYLLLPAALLAASAVAADLPIREVILFKHGVGYFERSGDVKAGETARLEFKTSEMDDVLKSLTLFDRAGGKIAGVRYDSSEPLGRKLGEFPFQVGGQQSLAAFFDQMKGARVELRLGAETVAGAIVGARLVGATDKSAEREQLVLLVDSGDLRTFDLAAAASIRFADATLQSQLRDYLTAVNQSRSKDKRSVYIDSPEGRGRQLSASYMVPTAVWKSTYRLIFGDKGDPTMEGWAIVDNTTGEDWTNVRLAVVSGRPVSFVSRLYEPRYRERPVMDLAEDRPVGPVVHEGGIVGGLAGALRVPLAPPPPPKAAPGRQQAAQIWREQGAKMADERVAQYELEGRREAFSSVAATAEGREVGELFEYRFAAPVTVRKSESAMLPFLQQKLAARKLLIYVEGRGQNPMNAAEITNSTGKTLDGGPITIYDANSYAGEALMETIKSLDRRLISYAVDLGTRVTTAFDTERDLVREIHFRRGVLTTRSALQETKTYTVRNVDQKAKTLVIEHPKRPDYKLLNQKPAAMTAAAYRFELPLGAAATEKFAVSEERLYEQSVALTNLTPDVLASYLQNKALSPAGKQMLEQIGAKKGEIAETDGALKRAEVDVNELVRDQERIRQNMYSLNNVSGQQEQVQRYARQLAAQEAKLATMRDSVSELRKKKVALESELSVMIEKMEF